MHFQSWQEAWGSLESELCPQCGVWLRWEGGAPAPATPSYTMAFQAGRCRGPCPGTGLSGGAQPTEPGLTGGRSPHHIAAQRQGKQCIGSLVPKAGVILPLHQAKQSAYGFPCRSVVKNPPTKQETWVPSLVREDPLEEEMATHSSILAWKILWTDGRLSMGSQRVRYNLATKQQFTSSPPQL